MKKLGGKKQVRRRFGGVQGEGMKVEGTLGSERAEANLSRHQLFNQRGNRSTKTQSKKGRFQRKKWGVMTRLVG